MKRAGFRGKVYKSGTSAVCTIPINVLKYLGIELGSEIDIELSRVDE